jgi:hypothetical protein
MNALARSSYLADYLPLNLFGDLRQANLCINDRAIHERILSQVSAHIDSDTVLVIGHSLGSVIG